MFQFTDEDGLLLDNPANEESQPEPAIKIEDQTHEAVLLTFENVVTDKGVLEYKPKVKEESGIIHKCKVCHLVFKSNKTLHMHQKRKHKIFRKSFKHICDYCTMSYETKNSLIAHMKRKHGPDSSQNDTAELTCEICALVFKGSARLRLHMRRKHGSYKESFQHVCDECGLTYDKHRSLIVHIQRKHSGVKPQISNQWFNCPFCPKAFTKRETYARHIQRKHQVNEDSGVISDTKTPEELAGSRNEQTGEITCKQCPLMFTSINYLKLHMRRKHNALKDSFRLKCRICNLSYDKLESLKRHVRRKHDTRLHCTVCNKHFNTTEQFASHTHAKMVKECTLCGLIFASEGGLAKHLRCTHKIDTPKTVFCHICNTGFHDKRQLKPHLLKVHLKVSYTCKFCNKVFKAKESYKRHIIVKHPTSTKEEVNTDMQKCDKCMETFKDEFELCRHINKVHVIETVNPSETQWLEVKKEEMDSKDSYQCTKCSDTYSTWSQLKAHYEQNHHIFSETQCQMCGEILSSNELQKHIKTAHVETIEMACKYCDFKTLSKNSLTQHTLRHKNAMTIHCDFNGCRYKTFYEGAMEKHKRKHKDLGVKFQCSQCPFQSMNKYILKYHEEAHVTGKKRYMCDQCDYATILPANLVQHKYKHSTEKRFKCEVCPFATKYNTSLRFHVRKKHCDLPAS